CIQSDSPAHLNEEPSIRSWLCDHVVNSRSFVAGAPDVARFFRRSRLFVSAISGKPARDRSCPHYAWRTVSIIPDAPRRFSLHLGHRWFLCQGGERCRAVPFRRCPTVLGSGTVARCPKCVRIDPLQDG